MTPHKTETVPDRVFDIPKAEALSLLGKSEKTLQRWVTEKLIDVEYRDGAYGKQAYYNRDDLLRMRAGKPRHQSDDAPLPKADLAIIARGAEWSNQQLTQALQNLSQQLPVIQEQLKELVKAKDETIKAKDEQGQLREELGKLKQSETHLHQRLNEWQSWYQRRMTGVIVWAVAGVVIVLILAFAFAPQLAQVREALFLVAK